MRFLLALLIGLLSFFYLAALFKQVVKIKLHSLVGLFSILAGIILGIWGPGLGYPLNILAGYFLVGAGVGIIAHHLLSERYLFSEKIERDFIQKHDTKVERLLEILPGALTWLALTSPIWLSFTLPFAVAYLIILADIYWLFNSLKIAILIFIGYKKFTWAAKQNWLEELEQDFPRQWEKYYHLLLLPTYKEPLEVLAPAFEAIAHSSYPQKKLFLAVGFEQRDDLKKINETKKYLAKYSKKIGGVFTTIHPFGLSGEVPGPGTNRNWMIKNAVSEFKKLGIKPEDVFVTTLDADFVIHPQFLAGALHKYLKTPENERDKRSFTGVFLYYNNYWQAPAPMRVIASGTAFWQISEMVGSDKYINFSSLSINLKSLLDVGLWIPDKVNDDAGFFWKAYYYFDGDYKVIPHYLPISADTVVDVNLLKTFQNQYLQLKRWAYGVEHLPFIIKQYFKNSRLDFWNKTDRLIFIIWSYLKWGTLALFITFGGVLIGFINPQYSESVVAYNLSIASSWVLTIAFLGLFSTIYVHEKTIPKRPPNWSLIKKFFSYFQWLLVPIVLVTIASLPAIDAQTTLMLGKYLEFRTTIKTRLQGKNS
ncbi:glycosyltransferase family 2 protein [Candidatus Daviesbacteria bacterium]|nr:glycosyltransferase family 2 protein [Candidatus Daviesbacteria bacterium]